MKVFLAATSDKRFIQNIESSRYVLESFYYFQSWQQPMIKGCKMFLLDSGAFTFFSSGKKINWNEYLDRYIQFINENNVDYFFELDIDALVGYEKVLEFRRRLERETGKQCIPVWHKSRGKAEWIKMCEEYKYVAIGGIASKEIKPSEYKYFYWFLQEAHKRGVKVHGLGFTSLKDLKKYPFYSVDSTSWKSGGRFGQLHRYEDGTIKTITQKEKRAIYKQIDENNFNEWLKFQKYAEERL